MGNKITGLIGKLLSVLCIVAFAALLVLAISSQMIPEKYLIVAAIVLAVLAAAVTALTWSGKHRARFILGAVLAVIFIVISAVGCYYIAQGVAAAKNITSTSVETAEMAIFVRAGEEDAFDENAPDFLYGILTELDRENTDAALEAFSDDFGFTLETAEYDGLADLADALLDSEEVDAIVLNVAYLDVLEEMDGYEDIANLIVQVTYHAVETVVEVADDVEISDTAFTVFISGIDSRSSTLSAKSRSDVNILAVVNTETRQVLLVSTPRDYYVPLSISNGRKDKLTHAGIYGIQVCMDTISMLYDVDVDYYFRLNFVGFVDIIDALGGITVVSDYTFTTQNVSGYSFVAGENEVDGAAALAFCRERYAFSSGDRQRGKNQLAVIEGVIDKLLSADFLLNYTSVLNALEDSFETSVPYSLISQEVKSQLADGGEWNIVSYSVDGTGDSQIPYSMSQYAYVMIPDESTVATAQELIQAVLNGEIISDPE
ncbi:MAG: LCP family protein [Oscillospiraceae bacterium]|nr:LCP family protein [Oscillospiraceae bacterium]